MTEVPHHSPVNSPLAVFESVDDLQRSRLRRPTQRARGERCAEHINGVGSGAECSLDRRNQVHDVAEALNLHEFCYLDRARLTHLRDIVAGKVDQHQMLCLFLLVSTHLLGVVGVLLGGRTAGPGPCNGVRVDTACLHSDEGFRG